MSTRIRPPQTRRYHRLAVAALLTAALSLAGAAPVMA